MKLHIQTADIPIEEVAQGVTRQILGYDSDLMLVKVNFETGSVGYIHKHPHQQASYVVEGKFEVEIDSKKKILIKGDAFMVPSNVEHGVVCLEKGTLIDTFSPMREDFINKNDRS